MKYLTKPIFDQVVLAFSPHNRIDYIFTSVLPLNSHQKVVYFNNVTQTLLGLRSSMNFCSLKGYTWWDIPTFRVEDKETRNKCCYLPLSTSYYFSVFTFKVHESLRSYERASWKEKTKTKQKNGKKKNKTKPTHPQLMAPPYERGGSQTDRHWNNKSGHYILQSHWTLSSLAEQRKPCRMKMDTSP